jgi:hypothetical protein
VLPETLLPTLMPMARWIRHGIRILTARCRLWCM